MRVHSYDKRTVKHLHTESFIPFYQSRRGLFDPDFNLKSHINHKKFVVLNFSPGKELYCILDRIQEFVPQENIHVIRPESDKGERTPTGFPTMNSFYRLDDSHDFSSPFNVVGSKWEAFQGADIAWIVVLPFEIDLMHSNDLLWNLPSDGWKIQTAIHFISKHIKHIWVLDRNYRFFDYREVFYFGSITGHKGDVCDLVCVKLTHEEIQAFYSLVFNKLRPGGVVLDVGTWLGGSALCFGKACHDRKDGSRVITIDHKSYPGLAQNIARAGLNHCVDPVVGDVFEIIDKKLNGAEFDVICDDIYFEDFDKLVALLVRYDSLLINGGYLMIQNYQYFGLWQRAVNHALLKMKTYQVYGRVGTTMVLQKVANNISHEK